MTAAEYDEIRAEEYAAALPERYPVVPWREATARPLPIPPRFVPRRRRPTGQPVDAQMGRAA